MQATATVNRIEPQPGFQQEYLSSPADIVIGGGAAGSGKTFASLLETCRNKDNPDFGAIFFRRTTPQIKNLGGLWDESKKLYPIFGAKPNSQELLWRFPSGMQVKCSHLEHEKDIYDHQGGQYALICFDELTHFTKRQFFYLLSRNRSTCGVRPYVRATCNPDPDSWVADFVDWFIDQETGFPIPERAGELRYFIYASENYVWGASKKEVLSQMPPDYLQHIPEDINPLDLVKSMTFIPGSIYQNKKLLHANPEYLANLLSQEEEEQMRLLHGNWKIRTDGLSLFEYQAINDLFTNYPEETGGNYITCDAARLGKDYTIIAVWKGWRVVEISILTVSEARDIVQEIEMLRRKHQVAKSNVVVDQDGVGGGTVKLGMYKGFSGGAPAMKDPDIHQKENYKNLKTQCYYRFAEKVNYRMVRVEINNECVKIDHQYGTKIKRGTSVVDIRDLMKADFKAVKKKDVDKEGKKQINSKEEQKIILNGRSPDFADCLMMREYFDLKPSGGYTLRRAN